jgi:hypothetical protein
MDSVGLKVVNKCTSFGRIKVFITVMHPIGLKLHSEILLQHDNFESNHVDFELLTTAGDIYFEISIENCKK